MIQSVLGQNIDRQRNAAFASKMKKEERRGEARRSPSASAPFIEDSKDLWEVSAGKEAKDYQGRESI